MIFNSMLKRFFFFYEEKRKANETAILDLLELNSANRMVIKDEFFFENAFHDGIAL